MFVMHLSVAVVVAVVMLGFTSADVDLHGGILGSTPLVLGSGDGSEPAVIQKYKITQKIDLEMWGNALYYFPPVHMSFNYSMAKRHCNSINLNLIHLDSQEEFDWIGLALNDRKYTTSGGLHHFWTSGVRKNGKWVWDETDEDIKYFNWHPGHGGFTNRNNLGMGAFDVMQYITTVYECATNTESHPFVCKAPMNTGA